MPDATPRAIGRSGGGDEAYEPPETLRSSVVTGVKWRFSSRLVREGSRLAIGILLARLLTPEEWGVAGMALVVAALLTMLADLSLAAALVQRPRITEADRSTMFWTALGIGVAVAALGIASSGLVADFFGEPEVRGLFIATCFGLVIGSFDKVPGALLTRDLAFRALDGRQIVATLVGAVVALVLALAGAGAWAIIGNSLAVTAVSAVLLWLMIDWRPRFMFSRASFRDLTGFGAALFGSQMLMYTQLNADKLLVGRFLGATQFGNYSFAFQLMFTPVINVAYPLAEILFPVLATIQGQRDRLNAAWLRAKRLSVAIMAPAFLLMAVLAPDLLPALFGPKWDDAIPVLQLLCLAGVAYSLNTVNGLLLLVTDNAGGLFRLSVIVTVTTTLAAAIGLEWGIVGVAAAYALAHWLLVLPELWLTTRRTSFPMKPALRAACSPLPFAFAAAGVAYVVRLGLTELGASALVRIAVTSVALLAAYVALAYVGSTPLRSETRAALARLRRVRMVRHSVADGTKRGLGKPER